jgi:8-oxo-dGTP pyrophosphatase MutT (NUDIX family)
MIAFEKSVGGIIFRKSNEDIKYLLLHYISGHWDFPKGHVEEDETEEETLLRETEEETGIRDLKIIPGFRETIRYFYKAKGEEKIRRKEKGRGTFIFKKVVFYLAETDTTEVALTEHIGFEWLNFEESMGRATYSNPRKVLEKANEFIGKKNIATLT